MKRVLLDFAALAALVADDAVIHVLGNYSGVALDFISSNILLIRISSVTIVGAMRALGEGLVLDKKRSWWSCLEWIAIVVAAHTLVCWMDVLWNPYDNFKTVFAFTFITMLASGAIASTIAYVIVFAVVVTWKRNDRVTRF